MNALIIEDEKVVAAELKASSAEVDWAITSVGTLGSVKTAWRWLAENPAPNLNTKSHLVCMLLLGLIGRRRATKRPEAT